MAINKPNSMIVALALVAIAVSLTLVTNAPSGLSTSHSITCTTAADCTAKLGGGYTETEVILTNDILNCPLVSGNCITFGQDGKVFNGNGFLLDGIGTGNGINLNGKSNIEITNTEIKDFELGIIDFGGGNNVRITNNHVHDNTDTGIFWLNGDDFYVSNNIIENNFDGIGAISTNSNVIKSNIIQSNGNPDSGNGGGLNFDGITNSLITANSILINEEGIRLSSTSNGNLIFYNHIEGNGIPSVDDGTNNWGNGYPGGGNFWRFNSVSPLCSDIFMGINQDQAGSDGLCDSPQQVDPNTIENYPSVQISFAPEPIALSPGFNLVSPSILPADTAIGEALASIAGQYDVVFSYNSGTGMWESFNPAKPAFLNSLTEITENRGFWINIPGGSPVSLIIDGISPINTRYQLAHGWNQIGYPSRNSMAVGLALQNVGSYTMVWEYNPANFGSEWTFYDPANPGVSTLANMSPGKGYWVEASQAVIWDFLNGKYFTA